MYAICDCYCRRCLLHDDCGGCAHIDDEAAFRSVHPITNAEDEAALRAALHLPQMGDPR